MACMEHICPRCSFWGMDNETLKVCPQCSSPDITNHNDEAGSDFEDDEEPEATENIFLGDE